MSRLSRRAILFAGALMSLPLSVYSAGLGKLTVLSNLGEPLRAEIEVVAVEKGERDSLSARLAAVEAYLQANLPYPSGAWGLKISLETRPNGEPYVNISSANPVSEPFVDVLVDLRWNGGRLLRAYTALLDPPAYTAPETVPPATPAPVVAAAPEAPKTEASNLDAKVSVTPLKEPPAEQPAELSAQPSSEPLKQPEEAAKEPPPVAVENKVEAKSEAFAGSGNLNLYTVKRGDTLSKIAGATKPAEVTLEQMLVLLYRANPEAFAGKNMNRLKTGKILRVPEGTELTGATLQEARKEIRIQTADWNAWREKIAGGVASTPAISESSQSASGSITTKIDEKAPTAGEQPKEVLKLSKGESKGASATGGTGSAKASEARVQALEEELAARNKAVTEANERVVKLEKTIKDMQALMEMKSKGMADMQKPAMKEAAKAEVPAAKPELPKVEPAKPAAEVQKPALTATKPAEPVPNVEGQKPAGTPQTPVVASAPKQPDAADSTRAEAKPRPKVTKPIKAPVPEPSLMEKILGEPLYLAGGAGLLALLGLGGFVAWRKRKAGAEEVEEADEVAPEIPPMGGEAHAEELPAPSAGAKAASDQMAEEVDPVAEADIYIAYGRDSQAENILKEALQTNPERHEIHLKLLEIYHKRKDVAAFAPVAETLFTATGGQGDIWQKAARMGYQLDAANPRYAGGEQGAPAETDITASGTSLDSKLDLDLGLGQAGDASTSTDIDLSELTVNAAAADLDLSSLTGKSQTADLDLRTQVLDSTRQMELGKTVATGDKTQQMPNMDLTMEMSRTQEANKAGAGKDGLDFDLDLSTITGGARGKAEPSGLDLDVGKISLDATMDGKSEPKFDLNGTSPSLPDVDLSSISLDLDKSGVSADPAAANKDEHWYDVQTKFDLAKAYQEMGDKEGAREILREVMQEGDVDQKTAAQKVMEALV